MTSPDTICAIATPPGVGALGVIRISGPEAFSILEKIFKPSGKKNISKTPSHTLLHGRVMNGKGCIDEALVSLFRAPRSYTGEDVAEISCHGSPAILSEILSLCAVSGARPAWPGEFTQRAFLNGKMDLIQAEAVAEVIAARSRAALRCAERQLEGVLSEKIRRLREGLTRLLADVEVSIDHPDEEIETAMCYKEEAPAPRALLESLDLLLQNLRRMLGSPISARILREGVRVAIIGKPNTGKSSLFNALVGAPRAIVTEIPGATRDVIEESILLGGIHVALVDTAGLRKERGRVEGLGIEKARQAISSSDMAFFVLDQSRPASTEDRLVLESLRDTPRILVLNKSDLPRRLAQEDVRGFQNGSACVVCSCKTGKGLENLGRAILESLPPDAADAESNGVVSLRQRALLTKAASGLTEAREALEKSHGLECAAVGMKDALSHLAALTGESVSEDVLDEIFSRFCIGK